MALFGAAARHGDPVRQVAVAATGLRQSTRRAWGMALDAALEVVLEDALALEVKLELRLGIALEILAARPCGNVSCISAPTMRCSCARLASPCARTTPASEHSSVMAMAL